MFAMIPSHYGNYGLDHPFGHYHIYADRLKIRLNSLEPKFCNLNGNSLIPLGNHALTSIRTPSYDEWPLNASIF